MIEALSQQICERVISLTIAGSYHDLQSRVDEYAPQQAQMAMLFPNEMHALQCERYIKHHAVNNPTIVTCTVSLASSTVGAVERSRRIHWEQAELHAVLYPPDLYPLAKDFWQHTGYGISSRYAEFCLGRVDDLTLQPLPIDFERNHAYSAFSRRKDPMRVDEVEGISSQRAEDGRIKSILRRRIAKLASSSDNALEEKHVNIFSSGMSAISTIAQALQAIEGSEISLNIVAYG